MNTQSETYWVVPFLDDVAAFLAEHGMPESSGIVAEAAANVQRCSQTEPGRLPDQSPAASSTTANVVTFSPRSRAAV